MGKGISRNCRWGVLWGVGIALAAGLIAGSLTEMGHEEGEAAPGRFVNVVHFPPVKPGREAEFLEWFRWSNELYARHDGFIARTLLRPRDGGGPYAAIVEHASFDTFMAMHRSVDREEAFRRVQPLLEGRPTPRFYEVVISSRR